MECGDRVIELPMLGLELRQLVEELTLVAKGREDAGLLATHAASEMRDEPAEPRHRKRLVATTQGLSDLVSLVHQGRVLIHQLADRFDLAASAVLTHVSPPGPNPDAVGGCRAAGRRDCGRRCRDASGSRPVR